MYNVIPNYVIANYVYKNDVIANYVVCSNQHPSRWRKRCKR